MSRKQLKTEDFVKIVREFYKKHARRAIRTCFCVRNAEKWLNSVYRQAQTARNGTRDRQEKLQAGTDTQRDKQLTAALGDAYAQKKHEKTANHKRKA